MGYGGINVVKIQEWPQLRFLWKRISKTEAYSYVEPRDLGFITHAQRKFLEEGRKCLEEYVARCLDNGVLRRDLDQFAADYIYHRNEENLENRSISPPPERVPHRHQLMGNRPLELHYRGR